MIAVVGDFGVAWGLGLLSRHGTWENKNAEHKHNRDDDSGSLVHKFLFLIRIFAISSELNFQIQTSINPSTEAG
jgi:hypothetical protein